MIDREEFKQFMKQGGYLLEKALTHRLSIQNMHYPRATFYHRIHKYQKQGLIRPLKRKKYGNTFILTEKGKILLQKPTIKKQRGDGLSTVILFDIPEEKRRARNIFRRYLAKNGYTLIQKSALISPLEISDELKELIEELKIKSYVKVISGKVFYI